jgi:hypothetical protein
MKTADLLNTNGTYSDAMNGWGKVEDQIRIGQKIRINFNGLNPKTGYAYKEEGAWLGIRYTWRSNRWWSLLNYNNPLVKLEVENLDDQGNAKWTTLWKKEI